MIIRNWCCIADNLSSNLQVNVSFEILLFCGSQAENVESPWSSGHRNKSIFIILLPVKLSLYLWHLFRIYVIKFWCFVFQNLYNIVTQNITILKCIDFFPPPLLYSQRHTLKLCTFGWGLFSLLELDPIHFLSKLKCAMICKTKVCFQLCDNSVGTFIVYKDRCINYLIVKWFWGFCAKNLDSATSSTFGMN